MSKRRDRTLTGRRSDGRRRRTTIAITKRQDPDGEEVIPRSSQAVSKSDRDEQRGDERAVDENGTVAARHRAKSLSANGISLAIGTSLIGFLSTRLSSHAAS